MNTKLEFLKLCIKKIKDIEFHLSTNENDIYCLKSIKLLSGEQYAIFKTPHCLYEMTFKDNKLVYIIYKKDKEHAE